MAFPTKMYFSLSEVSARWHRQTKDVEYCIENGLLNAHIKVCSVKLTSNMLLNKFPHNSQEIYEYTGCKRITPEDCHILFRHYKRQVSEFISSDDTKREKLVFPEKITIKKVDLMILLCDLKQFEEKYQLKYEEQDLPLWNNNVSSSEIAVNNDCDFFYIGNTTEVKVTPRVDDNTYKKTIDDIQNKLLDLKTPYDKAIALADKWKSETLKGLDSTKSGYQQYKSDVERIYDDMIKKAEESALNSSKSLEDGFRRGFTSIREEAGNFANLAESTVKNAFSNMEDALTTFVTTGKASFSDFANAIISDLTRIIIRQSITQPLLNGIASYFGFATAHTGGIVGSDNLRKTYASPAVFFNAPKFHGGGIVGDEVPIIAKRGEGVFTREQMKAIGDRESTVNISVNVINNASSDVKTSVTKSNQGNGKINLDIMIEKIENSMAKNVSKGTGLAPVLERRYGLNPAYGSYG